MPRNESSGWLRDMLDHALEILAFTEGKTRFDIENDRLLGLAVTRLFEVIGEAANRIPRDDRLTYSSIPWNEIINLRNRLIHGYDSVDFDIMWEIIQSDLPVLVHGLKEILIPEEGDISTSNGLSD
jgi:uncharacterized protein with HEPN domain